MKTKRRRSQGPQAESPLPAPPEEAKEETRESEAEETREKPEAERVALYWYLTEDGKIDKDRMRDSMKTRVKEMLPSLIEQFGEKQAQQAAASVEVMPEEWCETIYDVLGTLEGALFGKILKLDHEIAKRTFAYSKAEKEKLVPPTTRVINKYAPDWMLRYKDEIALGMLLITTTMAKIAVAKAMSDAMKKAQTTSPAPAPVSPPTPDKQTEEPRTEPEEFFSTVPQGAVA